MRKAFLLALCASLLCIVSCSKPPQPEIDAAKEALTRASQNDDIITYAPDSLRAAQEAMSALDAEVAAQSHRSVLSRSYENAKSLAAAAIDAARKAQDDAVSAKQQVARAAAALVDDLTASIPGFELKIWTARRVPRIKLDLIAPLAFVPDQVRSIAADAAKDIAGGAYAAAKAKLLAAKDLLSAGEETMTEETRIARSR